MKSRTWHASVLTSMLILCPLLRGQQTKVVEQSGHLSPVMVNITFVANNATRKAMLLGIGNSRHNRYNTHQWGVRTEAGTTERNLWLDNLSAIQGTHSLRRHSDEFTVVLKNGQKLPVSFSYRGHNGDCDGAIPDGSVDEISVCRYLYLQSEDDSSQKIDLRNVKSVEFLGPVRKDKAQNAMFDHWKFSPSTGEKLTAPAK